MSSNAQDFDGTVTNVAFYEGTNKLEQTTSVQSYLVECMWLDIYLLWLAS